ncbi:MULTISPECIES: xanthine dehydrogenase family protein subunit M [unclassified Chelatococcus]|uniref:FAD binding domain-containing protein n=1 Tax=unclassified Chelatococcus TaxID=2638111 RepID=UPI001BD04D99|nr:MULTISPECIES: xanthine dehydrogenase family protein subunit M [unclassified Chelatococcus]MBS7700146.1 xanthine dehydrogenase family protein subunit M [Chelatococcus sp. YT9]MBX3556839.1 xanthine dehydrogenase family protein subunit M [Chelatococcus sp.]
MYQTRYHRPSSIAEAVAIVRRAEDGKFLSGGMTLIPAMKTRLTAPSDLVDLRHVPGLSGIAISGREVVIGAATTHSEVASHGELEALCPAICHLAGLIGDPHVRHMGTIGGSVANNDPAADYPAAMIALNATIVTSEREILAEDFFTGLFETSLNDDEMVTAVRFTAPLDGAYVKFPNPASRYALAGTFIARSEPGIRVGVTGAGADGVFRSTEIEQALSARFDVSGLDGVTVPSDGLMSDIHASAEYRAHLVVVMARRAMARLLDARRAA